MKKRTIVIIVVVVVVAAAAVAGLVLRGAGSDPGPKGEAVRIENPVQGELIEFVNAPGEVEPRTKVAISARVTARIVEIPYQEGDRVTAGDPDATPPVAPSVLVRLDATDLEAALRSAEARRAAQAAQIEVEKLRIKGQHAQLAGTVASFIEAERDLKRCRQLRTTGDVSQSRLDDATKCHDELRASRLSAEHSLAAAEKTIEVLRHNLRAADAEIARARDAMGHTTITSPIDGVVTRINAKVGELVITGTMNNPGTVIIQVADLSEMLLVVQVDEADIGSIKVGQRADVRIHTYGDDRFEGAVTSIALTHDYSSGGAKYFKTKILLEAPGRQVYSGLTADVDIQTTRHADILKVPSQAVLGRPVDDLPLSIREDNSDVDMKKTHATVVYRFIDGKAVVTPVTIGASDTTHTIIKSGLAGEDRIVIGPYKILESIEHDQDLQDEREVEARKKAEEAAREAKQEDAGRSQTGRGRKEPTEKPAEESSSNQ